MPPMLRIPRLLKVFQPTLVVLLACVGCAGHSSGPTAPSAVLAAPMLTAPQDQAYFRQNDPSSGCRLDPVWGYGFRIQFSWTQVREASGYRIHMMHPDAFAPFVDEIVPTTQYELRRCTTAIGLLDNWKWKVRAIGPGGIDGDWSAVRTLNFTDCRIDNRPCGDSSVP